MGMLSLIASLTHDQLGRPLGDPSILEGIRGPVMATTAASPQFLNGPAEANVNVMYDWQQFCQLSRRRMIPYDIAAVPSGFYTTEQTVYPKKHGLLAGVRIVLEATVTVAMGGGSLTFPLGFPYNLLGRIRFQVAGQSLINTTGLDLWVRNQMRTKHFAGTVALSTVSASNGSYNIRIPWWLPIEMDHLSMAGAVFTETDAITPSIILDWSAVNQPFTLAGGATATFSNANIRMEGKHYDVPRKIVNGAQVMVLPRMDLIHLMQAQDFPVTNGGVNTFYLDRQPMQLLRLSGGLYNGASDWLDVTSCNQVGVTVNATTQIENLYPAYMAIERNAEDYNGRLAPNQFSIDFSTENATRDSIMPREVSEIALNLDTGGNTINVGSANMHLWQEGLASVAVRAPAATTGSTKAAA